MIMSVSALFSGGRQGSSAGSRSPFFFVYERCFDRMEPFFRGVLDFTVDSVDGAAATLCRLGHILNPQERVLYR